MQALKYLEDSSTNEVCYGGAAGGGKTVLGCIWQLTRRVNMPGSVGLIGREELDKLKKTTFITLSRIATLMGMPIGNDNKSILRYDAIKNIIYFPNGSLIFLVECSSIPSDPEFDRFGSYEITDAFIDEAQQVSAKFLSVLKGRFRLLRGEGWYSIPKQLLTCNPKRNHIYTDYVLPSANGTMPEYRKFIKALAKDNPFNDAAYLDNLLKADTITVQRLYYGNFEYDDDPSTLCDADAINDVFSNQIVPDDEMYISADLAMQGRDRFVAGLWKGLECRIESDIPKSDGMSIERTIKDIMFMNNIGSSHVVVDASGMGEYLESYIRGIKQFRGNESSITSDFANIKSECAYKLAELINKRLIRIHCDDRQKERISLELAQLKTDNIDSDDRKKRIIKKEQMKEGLAGASPDYLDMLIMRMYFEVKKVPSSVIIRDKDNSLNLPNYGVNFYKGYPIINP